MRAELPTEGPVGHAKGFVLNPVLYREPLDSRQGSVMTVFVFLKDHRATTERIKLAEVVKEAGTSFEQQLYRPG